MTQVRSEALLSVTLHLLYTQQELQEVVDRCHSRLYNEISLIPSMAKLMPKKTVLAKWAFLVATYVGQLTCS